MSTEPGRMCLQKPNLFTLIYQRDFRASNPPLPPPPYNNNNNSLKAHGHNSNNNIVLIKVY